MLLSKKEKKITSKKPKTKEKKTTHKQVGYGLVKAKIQAHIKMRIWNFLLMYTVTL